MRASLQSFKIDENSENPQKNLLWKRATRNDEKQAKTQMKLNPDSDTRRDNPQTSSVTKLE